MKTVMSLSPYALTISGSFLPSLVVSHPMFVTTFFSLDDVGLIYYCYFAIL